MNHIACAAIGVAIIAAMVVLILKDHPCWAGLCFITLCSLKSDPK